MCYFKYLLSLQKNGQNSIFFHLIYLKKMSKCQELIGKKLRVGFTKVWNDDYLFLKKYQMTISLSTLKIGWNDSDPHYFKCTNRKLVMSLFSPFISCAIFFQKNFYSPLKNVIFSRPSLPIFLSPIKNLNVIIYSLLFKTMIWNVKFKFFLLLANNFTLRIIKKIIDGIKILQKNEKNISTSVKSRTKKTTKKFVIVCVNI